MPDPVTPNPLPCGCAAMGVFDFAAGDNGEWRDVHVRHCPLHAAAAELLAAARSAVANRTYVSDLAIVLRRLDAALALTTGGSNEQ